MAKASFPLILLVLQWLLQGCIIVHVSGENGQSHLDAARADALFSARTDPGALQEVIMIYKRYLALKPDDPVVRARLAQAYYSFAYGHNPEEPSALELYEAGRENAWTCLNQIPQFSAVMERDRGKISVEAAQLVTETHGDCLLWLVACWVRWVEIRGPSAVALDLLPLQVLAHRACEMNFPQFPGEALHLLAMIQALTPELMEPNLIEPERLFQEAASLAPEDLSITADFADLVLVPQGRLPEAREALREMLEKEQSTEGSGMLENDRARMRARVILEEIERPSTGQHQEDQPPDER